MFLWFETQKFSTQLCIGNGTQLNCWEIWLGSDKYRTLGPHMTRSMLLAHQFVTNLTNSATVSMTQRFEGTLWHRDTGHIPWESNVLSFLSLSCVQWYTVWCRNNLVKFLENSPTQQGAVSIRKTVLPGMAIPMLKIRRPNGRLIFNMEIAIRR